MENPAGKDTLNILASIFQSPLKTHNVFANVDGQRKRVLGMDAKWVYVLTIPETDQVSYRNPVDPARVRSIEIE